MENAKLCWEKILEYEPKNKKVLKRLKKNAEFAKTKVVRYKLIKG